MSYDNNANTNPGEEGKKVILLDLSRTERAFEETESLWDIEIEKIEERLASHIESLEEYKLEEKVNKKPLLSIAILGYPGSGKTSMLHTLVERVNQGELKKKAINNNVYSLPMIKPNLVAGDDHFLYAFLAEALRKDRLMNANVGDPERETQFISRVQHKFQEVSEYLQVLNKSGHMHEGDPLGVSLERLERHESGLILIEKMAGFIDELADSLGSNTQSSVVLLPVDDADVSKEVLISALDTCWRFLRHPRLVPIFTFTGRLAEELLRAHYDEKINNGSSSEKLKEASTSLLVTENMAIQYLGRLFPVRNRIKMGLAASRVQAASYSPLEGGHEMKVSDLLQTASNFLFGHAHVPIAHPIRPPFRVVTLRRQIQIIDAIQGVDIEGFINSDSEKKTKPGAKNAQTPNLGKWRNSWGRIYDMTSWSLLNAHRDVLKEINLNLDDLYSWTPKGLRQVVLDSILSQDPDERGKLLKHWRYRTEDRRSQIISLLAANVFRPLMAEEPTGDDETEVIKKWWIAYTGRDGKCLDFEHDSFSVLTGLLWFLNLCIGFYLPQVLARTRLGKTGEKLEKEKGNRVTGIGWDLLSGPTHAVREALKNKKLFSSGMLFLDPKQFDISIKKFHPRFFLHVWCSYGFHNGWPWAAISLWRGLGLIAKIIEFYENQRKCVVDNVDDNNKIIKGITQIINKHFGSALVSSNLPTGETIEGYEDFKFDDWEYKDEAKEGEDSMEILVPMFADALFIWLQKNYLPVEDKDKRIIPMKKDGNWESSFIRRLHGESLMSIFWQDLENAYYKTELKDWTAGLILYRWKKLLSQYWEGCTQIKTLLESCPIWPEFRSHDLYQEENSEFKFKWGAVTIYLVEDYVRELEKAGKNKDNAKTLEKLKAAYIKMLEEADKTRSDERALKKLKTEYIDKLEEAVKNKGGEDALEKLKKTYGIEDEAEYIKKLATEEEKLKKEKNKLKTEEEKPAEEANKENVEENIRKLEGKIKNLKKIIKDVTTYNRSVEVTYNDKIGIKRAFLKDYGLFSDDQKPSKNKTEGSSTLKHSSNETKGAPVQNKTGGG